MLFQQSSSSSALSSHPSAISKTYSLTHSLTYLLTPWSRDLLEKLTSVQLVKKYLALHRTRSFITAFTSARHLSQYWASSIFHNKIWFYGEELLATRPTPKLEEHPLSDVRDCLFNIFAATHLQLEDMPCRGDRDPLITYWQDKRFKNFATVWFSG